MAIELSSINAFPGIQPQEPACTGILSWRVALSLIANASVSLWVVIGKALLLLSL